MFTSKCLGGGDVSAQYLTVLKARSQGLGELLILRGSFVILKPAAFKSSELRGICYQNYTSRTSDP